MSTQTDELDHVSWYSIVGLLVRAFFSSVLSFLGVYAALVAFFLIATSYKPAGGGLINLYGGPMGLVWGLFISILAVFLSAASFFLLRIRPEKKRQSKLGVLAALIVWIVGWAWYLSSDSPILISPVIITWTALVLLLLFSKQIVGWKDGLGLLLALLVGIGFMMPVGYHGYTKDFFLSPVWLSVALFPELIRFRSGWKGVVTGVALWAIFGIISFWIYAWID
ncbi:MAG: hypothetical protein L6461_09670 [Anaerolineae bacterium]|nr:hypothetical protein [Anaerolineae bacterium]